MESISPTPVPSEVIDYTQALEDIKYILTTHNDLVASQTEVLQATYVVLLFVLGVAGALLVLLTLYNFIKKCY